MEFDFVYLRFISYSLTFQLVNDISWETVSACLCKCCTLGINSLGEKKCLAPKDIKENTHVLFIFDKMLPNEYYPIAIMSKNSGSKYNHIGWKDWFH